MDIDANQYEARVIRRSVSWSPSSGNHAFQSVAYSSRMRPRSREMAASPTTEMALLNVGERKHVAGKDNRFS